MSGDESGGPGLTDSSVSSLTVGTLLLLASGHSGV